MLFRGVILSTRDPHLRKAWEGLTRRIQTTIETIRVTNQAPGEMLDGHIVTLVEGVRAVKLAREGDDWTGVLTEDCQPGRTAVCRHSGYACVRMAPGQTPKGGQRAFLGPVPGMAYTSGKTPIGQIADASHYGEDHPFAKVLLLRLAPHDDAPVGAGGTES